MATWLGTVYSYFQASRFCQTDNRLNRVFLCTNYSQRHRQKLKTNPRMKGSRRWFLGGPDGPLFYQSSIMVSIFIN